MWTLNVSQPYGPPRPVTGIALPLPEDNRKNQLAAEEKSTTAMITLFNVVNTNLTTGFSIQLKLHAVLMTHSSESLLQSFQQKYIAVVSFGLKFKIVFMFHFTHFNHVTSQKAKNSDSEARDNVNTCETDI
jgi:hypothetical protein